MYITKQKKKLADIENKLVVSSGEREVCRGKIGIRTKVQTTMYKINKIQGYFAQHGESSYHFTITLSGV